MKPVIILFTFFNILAVLQAKDTLTFSPPKIRWALTIAQSAVQDWKKGECVNVEFNNLLQINHSIKAYNFAFDYEIKTDLGFMHWSDKELQKNFIMPKNNLLDCEGKLKYIIGWKIDPFFSACFNTQITDSYKFNKDEKIYTAGFWDPVVSRQSWGFEFSMKDKQYDLTSNLGFSLKQTRADKYTMTTDDRKTKDII